MEKISFIGIDNSGKSSVVRSLENLNGVDTIYLTSNQYYNSKFAKVSGNFSKSLAEFGEKNHSKFIAGFAYLTRLIPYFFEEKTKKNSSLLISDRDPILDTLCYSQFYLPISLGKTIRPILKLSLESAFNYPSSFIYFQVSPEVSAKRNNKPLQLHNQVKSLSFLKELFEKEIFSIKKKGIPVKTINTEEKPLEGIIDEVKFLLKGKY